MGLKVIRKRLPFPTSEMKVRAATTTTTSSSIIHANTFLEEHGQQTLLREPSAQTPTRRFHKRNPQAAGSHRPRCRRPLRPAGNAPPPGLPSLGWFVGLGLVCLGFLFFFLPHFTLPKNLVEGVRRAKAARQGGCCQEAGWQTPGRARRLGHPTLGC